MKKSTAAFTLIELLVVIAIIAILAAILFPVFAQAKAAAKNAKTISGQKQIGLAFPMYQGDYDDNYQPAGTMNGNGASWATGACNADIGCPSWESLMYPYMKNFQLFASDFDRIPAGFDPKFGNIKRSFRVAANVVRGWAGVNTWDGQDYGYAPTNGSAIPAPGSTVIVTEQRDPEIYQCTWWPGAWSWECAVWAARSINTLANTDPVAWGTDTDPNVKYTDGIDFARGDHANYLYCDGHVKSQAKGYLFPGYDQRKNMNSAVDTTLKGICLDADPFRPNANDCKLPQQ